MIRFIDLRGQITNDRAPHFAFYNTITDRFLSFGGTQEWDSIADFRFTGNLGESEQDEGCLVLKQPDYELIERCVKLIPSDYFDRFERFTPTLRSYLRNAIFDVIQAGRFEHDHRWYLYAVDTDVRNEERLQFISAVMRRVRELLDQFK